MAVVFAYLVVALILFGISLDLAWTQVWLFTAVVFVAGVGGRALAERKHPGLMDERLHVDQGVKGWDKVLAPMMGFGILFHHVIVAGLDRYYGWTTFIPLWVQTLAFVFIMLG